MDCAAPASFTHTHTTCGGLHPPFPPNERIGGGPKERGSLAFSHRATPSASQLELAEGVEFLEKYAHLDHLEAQLAEGVAGPNGYLRSRQGSSGGSEEEWPRGLRIVLPKWRTLPTLPSFAGVDEVVAALSHWLNGICVTGRVSLPLCHTL